MNSQAAKCLDECTMKVALTLSLFDRFRRNKSATTVEMDRTLSEAERSLAMRLLREFAPPEAIAFLPQLDQARVTGKCSCGCPTVDLTVPAELRVADPPLNCPLADAFGCVDRKHVGVMLFQAGACYACWRFILLMILRTLHSACLTRPHLNLPSGIVRRQTRTRDDALVGRHHAPPPTAQCSA